LLLHGEDAPQRTTSSSAQQTDTQQPSVKSNVRPDQLWPHVDAKIITCQVLNTVYYSYSSACFNNRFADQLICVNFTYRICNARE